MSPVGPEKVSNTQECLLVSLGNREVPGVQGCSGFVLALGRNQGPWGGEQFPSSPQPVETPVPSSRALFSGAMPVWSVLCLSQKRVVWLRLRQDRLQTGWDGFPGVGDVPVSQSHRPGVGMGCLPPAPASTTGPREPPALCWGTGRGFFTSDGFSERDFHAGAVEIVGPAPHRA